MFDSIKNFQKKEGLKVDGVVYPDGPTVEKINDKISGKSPKFWCTNCGGPHGDVGGTGICHDCTKKS